jgi:hypothetical protein
MKLILLGILFISLSVCNIFSKISTSGKDRMFSTDYVTSTLGNYRFTLIEKTCQLRIETFTNNGFKIAGNFPE